jgi:hypothetical protein
VGASRAAFFVLCAALNCDLAACVGAARHSGLALPEAASEGRLQRSYEYVQRVCCTGECGSQCSLLTVETCHTLLQEYLLRYDQSYTRHQPVMDSLFACIKMALSVMVETNTGGYPHSVSLATLREWYNSATNCRHYPPSSSKVSEISSLTLVDITKLISFSASARTPLVADLHQPVRTGRQHQSCRKSPVPPNP